MLEWVVLSAGVIPSVIIGWLVVTRDPRRRLNQLYGLLTFTFVSLTIFNHFTLYPSDNLLTFIRLVVLATTLASATLLFLIMEIRLLGGKTMPTGLRLAVLLFTVAVALLVPTPAVFSGLLNGDTPTPVPGWGVIPFLLHFVLLVGTCVYLLIDGVRHGQGRQRQQYKMMLVGLAPILLLAPITSVLLPIFFGMTSFIIFSPMYLVFFLGMIGYAIIKHGLFDIRSVAARSVAYLLSVGTLVIAYALTVFTLAALVFPDNFTATPRDVLSMVVAIGIALTFQPVKEFFDRITDRVFFRDSYQPEKLLTSIGNIASDEAMLDALANTSLKTLKESLKSEFVEMVIIKGEESAYAFRAGTNRRSIGSGRILHMLNTRPEATTVSEQLPDDSSLKKKLGEADIALAVRLENSQKTIGYLGFGLKQGGDRYTRRDRETLTAVADELAIAIQNAMRLEEIQRFNMTLQNRIEEATSELRRSNKKLQALDAVKDEFISMASHQLRTPLTSIKGYLSMVLDGDAGELNPMQRKFLGEAYNSSQRMVFLIGDFLNVSRLNTGKFVIEHNRTNLADMVAEEVEQLQPSAAARQMRIEYHKPARFPLQNLDENKLRQVVMNFMDNAIYYSKPGGVIKVELTHSATDITLKVKDQGIGVPAAQQHHLFEKFYRATNAQKARPDGSGIGLFLAKKVIIAHSGSVIFESTEGKGSTFGFKLPLIPFNEAVFTASPAAATEKQKLPA